MKIVLSYIKTALYNIKRNKAYAIFYILGTTLAFVFIAIILHVVKLITTDAEPMLYGDRIVTVSGSQLTICRDNISEEFIPWKWSSFLRH